MMTFSINDGTTEESVSYFLVGGDDTSLNYILQSLKDNEDKEVSPIDLRNSILSLYSSIPFKETGSYIGLDTINPNDRDLKGRKIFLGKRSFDSNDIMSDSLLNSDVDIFLYNTKPDNFLQNTTEILLLAGSNLGLHSNSPKIQSQIILGYTESRSLDFINPFGDINIESKNGTVSIANVVFPTILNSSASASSNKTLMYENGKLEWSDITLPATSSIGTSSSDINILGNVLVNGYNVELIDDRYTPITFGDIQVGETFSSTSISELLRRILYPYLPPLTTISLLPPYESGYVEVGTYPTPSIQYTITKRSESTNITSLQNMIPGVSPAITSSGQFTVSGISSGIVISPISDESTEFRITVSDGLNTSTSSVYITGIYPFFYGFSDLGLMTNVGLGSLSKLVENKTDKTVDITGDSNLYFIYDFDYGTLSSIYDYTGVNIIASFSNTDQIFSSPTGLWAGKRFYVYKYDDLQVGPPSENYIFQF
jgi:hypothetical protein